MAEPFLGEIIMFGGNFAPRGWALCDGQLLAISQNDALFSLLGTIYGGDGRTTFGLPDLRGRAPIHEGSGPGLTPRTIGQKSGTETQSLSVGTMPAHTHTLAASSTEADSNAPAGKVLADTNSALYAGSGTEVPTSIPIGNSGGGGAHENMMPFLVINFCIALQGLYPSRA